MVSVEKVCTYLTGSIYMKIVCIFYHKIQTFFKQISKFWNSEEFVTSSNNVRRICLPYFGQRMKTLRIDANYNILYCKIIINQHQLEYLRLDMSTISTIHVNVS